VQPESEVASSRPDLKKERLTLLPEFALASKKTKELAVSLFSDELFTLLRLL
jgi:hypothetical protein